LTHVDDWVHQEFASIDELLVGAGCNRREASGPGRVYRRRAAARAGLR
jgi:hypothetical protein